MPQYPKDWPKDSPPSKAEPALGIYFRAAKSNPPSSDEFITYAELGRLPKADPCRRSGLSLLRSREDAVHQTQLFPKLGGLIFQARLTAEHGKTLATPASLPSHTTWWPCEGIDRAALFHHVTVS
jgi:hypothetical protein